jgi:succinate dehydrogenase/fumarate reductase cytochrome b subunit
MNKEFAAVATRQPAASLEKRLVLLQSVAGLLFLLFLIPHLANTLIAPLGPDVYDRVQRVLRLFYQDPLLEWLVVLLPLLTHALAGVWLLRLRDRRPRGLPARLHRWAGLFMLVFILGHVAATRGLHFWYGVSTGFAGISYTFWWLPGWFYPYYFLLFVAGFYHGGRGLLILLRRLGVVSTAPGPRASRVLGVLGAGGALIALLSFGGVMYDIHDPRDNEYARLNARLMGVDLKH